MSRADGSSNETRAGTGHDRSHHQGTPPGIKMSGGRIIRAPFIDPVTGIAYDTNNSEFEGYLTKQSLWLRVSLYVTVASVVPFLVSTAPAIDVYHAIGFSFFCMF